MSKPVLRIILAVLISLGVILAIAATVPSLGLDAGTTSVGEQTSVAGRVSLSARADASSSSTQFDKSQGSGHECGSYSDAYADD
jgi:hypothetical protein